MPSRARVGIRKKRWCICWYAVATNKTDTNMPLIIEPKAFGGLLRVIADHDGGPETLAALRLLPLTLVRPGAIAAMAC